MYKTMKMPVHVFKDVIVSIECDECGYKLYYDPPILKEEIDSSGFTFFCIMPSYGSIHDGKYINVILCDACLTKYINKWRKNDE